MATKRKEPESQRIRWFLYSFELKDLGIGIVFEKENINTLDAKGEVLLTILSSLAQDESRSISENCTWGIRRRFETGKHKMSTKRFLGYDTDENGKLVINRMQEPIVVRLYQEFLDGKQRITSRGFLKKREFRTGMAVRSGRLQP